MKCQSTPVFYKKKIRKNMVSLSSAELNQDSFFFFFFFFFFVFFFVCLKAVQLVRTIDLIIYS